MSVYSIARSQLCFNWVLDYVIMRLLSLTQFIWRPSSPVVLLWHSQNQYTRSNVTVPWCQCIPSQEVIVFSIGVLDYVSIETALPHTIHLETIRPPVLQLWHSQESIHVVMSLYLMWVYSITRSQLCFKLGAWLCKHEDCSPHTIHLDTIRSSSCAALALTESIQVSNVTVPDVSVFHGKESIVFQLGAWLCKAWRLRPSHNFMETIGPPVSPALALTESIHVGMSLYLMSVYSIARSQLCEIGVLDYVSMRLLSLTQFHLENHPSPASPALALTESIHVVMSLYLMWVYSITRSQIVLRCGCLIM